MSPNPAPVVPAKDEHAQIISQLRPALLHYFRRKTGDASEAEDLTQDVLLRALLHASWKTPEQARGYIFRIAVNCWRDRKRRVAAHGISTEWNEISGAVLGTQNPPECVLVVREELDQVAAALEELNVRTRTVLMLIKVEQMRIATVAEMLGISVSAVNKHLARGLARLAELRRSQEGL